MWRQNANDLETLEGGSMFGELMFCCSLVATNEMQTIHTYIDHVKQQLMLVANVNELIQTFTKGGWRQI